MSEDKAHSNDVLPIAIQGINDPKTAFIYIEQGTAVAVNKETGKIIGANAEGTLGIIIYGGDPEDVEGGRFKTEKAIRIPRLLQSDILLNFHVAEIAYHESRQAKKFASVNFVLGATSFYRFAYPTQFSKIPDATENNPCFIGFYLSPLSHHELCLVSPTEVWPEHFGKYLADNDLTPAQLFEDISRRCGPDNANTFGKLLFLADRRGQSQGGSDSESILRVLDRKTLEADRAKRDVGGWWFNIPVAIYPWMTANLERLLAGYLDSATVTANGSDKVGGMRKWNLHSWFQLIKQLTLGIKALHVAEAIHGDTRPANIMTYIQERNDIEPESFRWIDIGLGYGAQDVIRGGTVPIEELTTITPRPLGGGRSTIFYAPEREEAQEFEDADIVSLEKHDDNLSKLTFYWREQTHVQDAAVLPLKSGETPLRELGELKKGDRIQVREFLFEVDRVESNSILVSGIYEIFLERVLVEKRDEKQALVRERLKFAPISRYRIFKQWSQATDIYGLGIITLYLFFIRGLSAMRHTDSGMSESKDALPNRSSIYDRANRERIFHELAILLRNRSFLENVLHTLKTNRFEEFEFRDHVSLLSPGNDTAKNIADIILSTDTNFEFIWLGLNGNNGLFMQVIYFCLRCVWRQDEIMEILRRTDFSFDPFCASRLLLENKDEQSRPSEEARKAVETLTHLISAAEEVNNASLPSLNISRALGITREEQMITLRQDLKVAKETVAGLENSLSSSKETTTGLENSLSSCRDNVTSLETSLSSCRQDAKQLLQVVESADVSLARINEVMGNITEELGGHKMLYGKTKADIDESIREVGMRARTAKEITEEALSARSDGTAA